MAFPSQAFCFLSSPPCFSDHHLVSSFCYCTLFPCRILMSLAGINLFQPRNKDQASSGQVHVFFISMCSHKSAECWNIFPFTAPPSADTQRSVPSVIILTNFLFVRGGINQSRSESPDPKQGQILFQKIKTDL